MRAVFERGWGYKGFDVIRMDGSFVNLNSSVLFNNLVLQIPSSSIYICILSQFTTPTTTTTLIYNLQHKNVYNNRLPRSHRRLRQRLSSILPSQWLQCHRPSPHTRKTHNPTPLPTRSNPRHPGHTPSHHPRRRPGHRNSHEDTHRVRKRTQHNARLPHHLRNRGYRRTSHEQAITL